MARISDAPTKRTNTLLWVVQALLALLFLATGMMKLVLPISALTGQIPFPGYFLRGLGVLEVLGALGLILPELLRIARVLTPAAAAGLVIIMIGATVVTAKTMGALPAIGPAVVGVLAALVARGRWKMVKTDR